MRFLPAFILPLFLASFLLSGCGKKGVLYIPDAPAQAQPSQPAK